MKVCPKCNSTYSDETLNFCLTDGVPLVVEEVLDEYLSRESSWHTAETLLDPRFSAPPGRQTTVNPSAPTLELGNTTSRNLLAPKSNTFLYAILGVLLVAVIGGGLWWFSKSPAANKQVSSAENTPFIPKRAVVQLSPDDDARVKREVADFLASWNAANVQKDIEAHISHYAPTLEIYYKDSGVDKNIVRSDRLRAYQRYDSITMQIDNLKVAPESAESASVIFDKSWTMKNAQKTSTGSVQQEVHVSKQNGKWLIDSEKDLKVYFLNNRENQTTDNPSQAANNSSDANETAK